MAEFGQTFRVPDFWQAEAVAHLKAGRDVVLHAPTGTGKTFVFESYFAQYGSRATFTVPTRALANDKYAQWSAEGWRVGISTGDRLENPDAPLLVATLETRRESILSGEMRGLFVIDEYQLLGDESRGAAYETAIAALPRDCQLLLMSGSVENSADVVKWLKRIGRDAVLVRHDTRAVPIEEVCAAALPETSARGIRGFWPNIVQRAYEADMCPLLIFAPKRRDAEAIAESLAEQLPCRDFLKIPREIDSAASKTLSRLIKRGIAYHHSGLTAFRRAGIVEKLARDGLLKAVVATTGLGAGVNFSMKSVIVADREYETPDGAKLLRPDELLQMYGRAGRRGKDTLGYAITIPSKPSLSQAHTLFLSRADFVDWPAILRIMDSCPIRTASARAAAASDFCSRLFTENPPDLGFGGIGISEKPRANAPKKDVGGRVEILNSRGLWERRKPKCSARIGETLFRDGEKWTRFDTCARAVKSLKLGAVCRLANGRFGLLIEVAKPAKTQERWAATRPLQKMLRSSVGRVAGNPLSVPEFSLKNLKRNLPKYVCAAFAGAKCADISVGADSLVRARIDLSDAQIEAFADGYGARLFNPPSRSADVSGEWNFGKLAGFESGIGRGDTPVAIWRRLGLVDSELAPTRRGRIFSYFSKGEGLAIAAALEDESYAVEDIAFDLANLRAGRRFALSAPKTDPSSRIGDVCSVACFGATVKGYLRAGVPTEYGAGASEVMRELRAGVAASNLETPTLTRGDIERARLEWESLMRHTVRAPDMQFDRWTTLKRECSKLLGDCRATENFIKRAF